MSRRKRHFLRFREGFGLGDLDRLVAERDPLLPQYYVGHDIYLARALDRNDDASVFVGPKGIGKSAVLEMVRMHEEAAGNSERLIEVKPDDLAFNALVNVKHRSPLLETPRENQWLFKCLWDYVLAVAVLQKEYGDESGLQTALSAMFGSRHEAEQRRLLKASTRDGDNPTSMTGKMLDLVSEIEMSGSFGGAGGSIRVQTRSPGEALPSNTSSDLKMLQLINNVAKGLSKQLNHDYYILIDDLDLHWQGTAIQNAFLGALFFSMQKLSWSSRIKCVVSMRREIYRQVELEERDKFADYICEMQWRKSQIKEMVEKRITYLFACDRSQIWGGMFPVDAFEAIWQLTNGMPREVIRASNSCIKEALLEQRPSVDTADLKSGLRKFSEDRLDDLCNNWRHTYPGLRSVCLEFTGGRKQFSLETLEEVSFRLASRHELNPMDELSWAFSGFEQPLLFAQQLARAGLLLVKEGRDAPARAADEDDLLRMDDGWWYSIHPTFHLALKLDGT